jgi:hypothetical protein
MSVIKSIPPSSTTQSTTIGNTIATNYAEPPILGAPILFELIRSMNVVTSDVNINANEMPALPNAMDSAPGMVNITRYSGFYFKKSPAPVNFIRNSLVNSNPYIFLTGKDIDANAAGIEEEFTTYPDTAQIKNAMSDYWQRLGKYDKLIKAEKTSGNPIYFDGQGKYIGYYPNMHLMYAYMMENTKIVQIFEKIIMLYQNGEDLTIPMNNTNLLSRPWLDNTHLLFYSNSPYAIWNDNSLLGSNFEAIRRNAFFRIFGLDLNHGIGENNTQPVLYNRANHTNSGFIAQLENFLKLCWQMIINFSNTSSVNTTDLIALQEQANALKNMLLARRTTENNLDNYPVLNLSKVEYTSVVMMHWLNHAISYNSPIVREMGAEGVTAAERLSRLGQRVNIPCHSKAGNFLDLAPLLATLLRLVEMDEVDTSYITAIAKPSTREYALITSILYNYQLATGRDLKNQVMVNNNYSKQNRLVNA